MNRTGWTRGALVLCVPLTVGLSACSGVETTGTSTLTVEIANLVGAQDSDLSAEFSQSDTSYFQQAPSWQFNTQAVTTSPFTYTDTLEQLPAGDFTLSVLAGWDEKSQAAQVKGQGCEMAFTLGADEDVTIAIDGLNEFGDKGYGECNATITR